MLPKHTLIRRFTLAISLCFAPVAALADSILVDQPRGALIRLVQKGEPACGSVDWGSVRRAGQFSIGAHQLEMKEAKLPLDHAQWEGLLTRVVGEQREITIAHAWENEPAGLAAALRVAYDIRSQGGLAWVLNSPLGPRQPHTHCRGNYQFTGQPTTVYLSESGFWAALEKGALLDARGAESLNPPSYTWVAGTPNGGDPIDIAAFMRDGKLDRQAVDCKVFEGHTVVGCDSLHKSMLVAEAARYANCAQQPSPMPYWGLAGASRDRETAQRLWGKRPLLNDKRSGDWN